jgi:Cytochrome P450
MPGASFKRKAREWRAIAERFYTIPFDFVKESMKEGTAKSSFTSLALRDISEKDDAAYQEELIKSLGGTMYTGAFYSFSKIIILTLACSWCRYGAVPEHIRWEHSWYELIFQTVSILLTFFLAMLMNPEAQAKAQEEIDRVIGTDRLPTFDDEAKLPYVSALSREVFRWQQVAPFGMQPKNGSVVLN